MTEPIDAGLFRIIRDVKGAGLKQAEVDRIKAELARIGVVCAVDQAASPPVAPRPASATLPEIIDVATDVGALAPKLFDAGVRTVIRYYGNTSKNPQKFLDAGEAAKLHAAGIKIAAVFEQRGGSTGIIDDLSAAHGKRDGLRALELAKQVGQPQGSGIYFAIDYDFSSGADIAVIASYFAEARRALDGQYRIGAYGSGLQLTSLLDKNLIDLVWLAGATGWHGTKAFRDAKPPRWHLFQNGLEKKAPLGFNYDGNIASVADYGQF